MKTLTIISTMIVLVVVLSGCRSPNDVSLDSGIQTHGGSPLDIKTYGIKTSQSIVVAVIGEVNRPGYYYLCHCSIASEAVEAAQGLSEYGYWGSSGIMRLQNDEGEFKQIRFDRNRKGKDVLLQDGDTLVFRSRY